jgi:transketolase
MGKVTPEDIRRLKEASRKLRRDIFDLSRQNEGYHFGGSLSCADILVDLYDQTMGAEDRFILSKGHAAFALYPLLIKKGFCPRLSGHPDMDSANGIYCTTGSLGMGFPTGLGMAFARKLQKKGGRIYVLLGEAECQEGTTWESLLIASQHKLDNLTGIVDFNQYQGSGRVDDILSLGDLGGKFGAFGARVYEVDGHSHQDLAKTLDRSEPGKCTMIIAHTVKGKGVKMMEQDPGLWHARFPTREQLREIYRELGGELE